MVESEEMFVKVVMRVLFEERSEAENYRELAEGYDSDDECCERRRLLKHANELDAEELPSSEELFAFLSEKDYDIPRFAEMIDVCVLWHPVYNARLYLDDDEVKISFVLETSDKLDSVEAVEETIGDDPFYKSKVGGHVGNYCKFPSRIHKDDQLGELNVDVFVTQVTDLTGNVEWIEDDGDTAELSEEESDEGDEEEPSHPFYMTHEDLFGKSDVDLDAIEVVHPPKKSKWSLLRMFTKKA